MDGLLGVAGMIINYQWLWIIPENSLRLAPVRWMLVKHGKTINHGKPNQQEFTHINGNIN